MEKCIKIWSICILSIMSLTLNAQITINGNAYLQNQSSHHGIKIKFERTTPTSYIDSTITDTYGFYSKILNPGVYNIYFSKSGYVNDSLSNVVLTTNTTLQNMTLLIHSSLVYVPTDISSIQQAINNAFSGDTIIIESGLYYETIDYLNKDLIIASLFLLNGDTSYIRNTILDGSNSNIVVNINSSGAKLIGLTITHGYGAGITTSNSPKLNHLIIKNNIGESAGGILASYGSPLLENILIQNNTSCFGGGIYTVGANLILRNVIISGNTASTSCGYGGIGGGIYFGNGGVSSLENVVFDNNTASVNGSAFYVAGSSRFNLTNSIITNNHGSYVIFVEASQVNISYCDFWNNQSNLCNNCNQYFGTNLLTNSNGHPCDFFYNIQLDPLYNSSYKLQSNSPCIDAGINDSVSTPIDFYEHLRIWDGNNDYINIVDMGISEYGAPAACAPIATFTYINSLLNITFNNLTLNGNSFNWDFGDGYSASIENPYHSYQTQGIYNVCLTVTNNCGSDSVCQSINLTNVNADFLNNNLNLEVVIDNSFEALNIIAKGGQQVSKICIYNEIGQIVFSENSLFLSDILNIDISNFNIGFYFIKIDLPNKTVSKKFTILK